MFALFGWAAFCIIAAWAVVAGILAARVSLGFSGRVGWLGPCVFLAGCAGLYLALTYGPVSVTLKAGYSL